MPNLSAESAFLAGFLAQRTFQASDLHHGSDRQLGGYCQRATSGANQLQIANFRLAACGNLNQFRTQKFVVLQNIGSAHIGTPAET